ncbi:MAG TPA: type II toxin-antitoxin system RelE/ParE family toxin [Stellaceae bacterium]|nr:type II toxin-antitoxin system RelE/ParE family toxin [Stellaceae bacterium]
MRLMLAKVAVKEFAGIPSRDRAALLQKLRVFADDPYGDHPWALPMRGRANAIRIRQGDWRAVCRIDRERDDITVEFVANRREAYR